MHPIYLIHLFYFFHLIFICSASFSKYFCSSLNDI